MTPAFSAQSEGASKVSAGKGICSGLRVVEFAAMIAGPLAGQRLADLGAEVIKVEPLEGDPFRQLQPVQAGLGAFFVHANRGKKSIVIDLKRPQGVALARQLAQSADVLLENYRPGVLDRIGLSYESLREDNPGLIYASVSGFGRSGPDMNRPAYDAVIQGMSGIMQAQAKDGVPRAIRSAVADKITAVCAASAILGALLYRERSGGIGQRVDISMLDCFTTFILADWMGLRSFPDLDVDSSVNVDVFRPLRTADGWLILMMFTNAQFAGACEVFGCKHLVTDKRFGDPWARSINFDALWDVFSEASVRMMTADILKAGTALNVPMAKVNTFDEFFEEPQVRHNEIMVCVEDPQVGSIRQLKYPANFEKCPAQIYGRAPLLGEHSTEVLQSIGMDTQHIQDILSRGIVK